MIRNSLLEILGQTWPMILVCVVILVTLRICYLLKNKEKIILYKEFLSLAFVVYVLCMFYVVTFEDVSWSSSNFIPFKEMFRYEIGSRLFFKNIIGNIIMFMPYGFMVGYYLKLKKPDFAIVLTLTVSICIETIQLVIGRVFDIDDIILNLMGGIIGAYIYTVLYKIESILPSFLKKDWFYNIIILIVSLIFILYLLDFINLGV